MSETWTAIRPGRLGTRVLAVQSDGQTLLKARLKTSPAHPRALGSLLEALALWEGQMVRAVLVAGAEAGCCGTTLFRECFADFGRPPLYELSYSASDRREPLPRGRDPLGGFADLRQLLSLEEP
jgi:hypothetical protein